MRIQTLSPFIFSELEREVTSSEPGRSSTHMVQTPLFIIVRNVVAARLCFRRRLSFCSQRSCVYPSMHWGRHLLGRPPGRQPPPPRQTSPRADTPPPRWPLQWTVRILWNAFLFLYLLRFWKKIDTVVSPLNLNAIHHYNFTVYWAGYYFRIISITSFTKCQSCHICVLT